MSKTHEPLGTADIGQHEPQSKARKMGGAKRDPALARDATRRMRQLIISWRLRGMSYRAIAEGLQAKGYKISGMSVSNYLQRYFDEQEKSTAHKLETMRMLEDARLDELVQALYTKLQNGDEKAINLLLQISNRRAKLWGLDLDRAKRQEVIANAFAELLNGGDDD